MLRIDVMGVGIDGLTMEQFTARAAAILDRRETACAVTPNAEILWEAMKNPGYREILNGAALVLPDGAGVVLGAKMLGTPIPHKVAGIDFGQRICAILAGRGGRLFLLGGRPGVAAQAGARLTERFPGLRICGTADGYFPDDAAMAARIAQTEPDAVFVCLGAPKQEIFMHRFGKATGARLLIGLGGSLDVYAGVQRRAPEWMISCNLEWFYRLLQDPSRFGRMLRLPKFVGSCLREQLRRKRKNG